MHRFATLALGLSLVAVPVLAQAPEADVAAAMRRTLDAYNKGDTATFNAMFLPGLRGFFVDNSVLTSSDDIRPPAPATPAPKPSVEMRHLSVRVYGNAAVLAGYFVGTLYVGTEPRTGTWRFTETRIKDGNTWKVAQFHLSRLEPAGS